MKLSSLVLPIGLLIGSSAAFAQEAVRDPGSAAIASMKSPDGSDMGQVTFTKTASGMLHVIVEIAGVEAGPHGFHVHETGQCDGAGGFESAQGHLVGGHKHGVNSADGPHLGDFPNVHAGPDGVVKVEFFDDRLSLDPGSENSLMDDDGSAVILHAGPDDYTTDPSGNSGDRIACGVIEQPS